MTGVGIDFKQTQRLRGRRLAYTVFVMSAPKAAADSALDNTPPVQLKEWFNEARYRWLAEQIGACCPGFDRGRFLKHVLEGLAERELLQRLRRTTEAFHLAIPGDYGAHLEVLRALAPRIGHSFVGILPCDYVGCHGLGDFDRSMQALAEFTKYGSGEFAVREYLRADFDRALRHLKGWVSSPCEHVRRLASEGLRPRLPWSFQLRNLIQDPTPAKEILEALRVDPSIYVRKSVANHLNDISKSHPELMLGWLERWDLSDERSAWIAKHACRTLIKAGDARALGLFKVGKGARVEVAHFGVSPKRVRIGGRVDLALELLSVGRARVPQRLIIDFAVHFAREGDRASRKVFKWKMLELGAGQKLSLSKGITLVQRSTRRLVPGVHRVELLVNGECLAEARFTLS